jgi:hypothetical protein
MTDGPRLGHGGVDGPSLKRAFQASDRDRDGVLSATEFRRAAIPALCSAPSLGFDATALALAGGRQGCYLGRGDRGGRSAPLASRFHRIPTHFPLHLHGIHWKLPIAGPPG